LFFKRALFCSFFIAGLMFTPIFSAPTKAEKKTPAIIADILIEGDYFVPKYKAYDEIDLEIGDPYRFEDIHFAQRALKDLGIYANVSFKTEETPKGYVIKFVVVERPIIGDVQFFGASAFTEEQLKNAIQSKYDEVENFSIIQEDIAALNDKYQQAGYIDCKVVKIEHPKYDGEPLKFYISEKLLTEVRITGNKMTKPYVITREMVSKLGQPIKSETLKEDIRRIYNLNYFSAVEPRFYEGPTLNSQILELDITEKRNGTFTFGGGYGAVSGFNVFTNFSWENFLGMGQLVAFNGEFGRASTYRFNYSNPWMWDERKSFALQLWSRNGGTEGFNPLAGNTGLNFRNEISNGVLFGFGFPGSYQLRTQHNFKFENVELTDLNRKYTIQSYNVIVSNDTRDFFANPRSGAYQSVSVDKAFPMTLSSIDYTRLDLDLRNFNEVLKDQVFATRALYGVLLSGQIGDEDLFAREYYRVGGTNSVRGYDDFSPFAFGEQQFVLNMEYRFIMDNNFQWLFFLDAGYANKFVDDQDPTILRQTDILDFSKYRVGKGVGLRLTIPMLGAIRLDLGIDDRGNQRIHFNIGNSF